MLLNNGSIVPVVGFEEGYIPELGEQVALVDGAAYPILRGVRSAEIKAIDGDVLLEGKRYRSASSNLSSGSGVAFLLLNESTGEERCLAIRID